MILIADSGSTKTDWSLVSGAGRVTAFATQGINPFHQDGQTISSIVEKELLGQMVDAGAVGEVQFYGAGCRGEGIGLLRGVLGRAFPNAGTIDVAGDLMAAARALCGTQEGIACILGTGANSCLFDGEKIVGNVSPLGYILGDEGSGAVLGRLFVNEMFKGDMPRHIREAYLEETHQTVDDIIRRVYREPMANRYLASMSEFVRRHLDEPAVRRLVVENFVAFFRRNVRHYGRPDLPVGAVGSIAFHYEEELREAAAMEGFAVGKVIKSPMQGLLSLLAGRSV